MKKETKELYKKYKIENEKRIKALKSQIEDQIVNYIDRLAVKYNTSENEVIDIVKELYGREFESCI